PPGEAVSDQRDKAHEQRCLAMGDVLADALPGPANVPAGLPPALAAAFNDVPARRRRWGRPLAWSFLASAAAAGVAVWLTVRTRPVEFAVDGAVAEADGFFQAPARQAASARFSDGTVVSLAPGGAAQVKERTPDGATVAMTRGSASFAVKHRPHASWHVEVGRFDIAVTGTEFEVRHADPAEGFELRMRSGAVIVRGPLTGGGIPLYGGQRLVASLSQRTLFVGEVATPAGADPAANDRQPRGSRAPHSPARQAGGGRGGRRGAGGGRGPARPRGAGRAAALPRAAGDAGHAAAALDAAAPFGRAAHAGPGAAAGRGRRELHRWVRVPDLVRPAGRAGGRGRGPQLRDGQPDRRRHAVLVRRALAAVRPGLQRRAPAGGAVPRVGPALPERRSDAEAAAAGRPARPDGDRPPLRRRAGGRHLRRPRAGQRRRPPDRPHLRAGAGPGPVVHGQHHLPWAVGHLRAQGQRRRCLAHRRPGGPRGLQRRPPDLVGHDLHRRRELALRTGRPPVTLRADAPAPPPPRRLVARAGCGPGRLRGVHRASDAAGRGGGAGARSDAAARHPVAERLLPDP